MKLKCVSSERLLLSSPSPLPPGLACILHAIGGRHACTIVMASKRVSSLTVRLLFLVAVELLCWAADELSSSCQKRQNENHTLLRRALVDKEDEEADEAAVALIDI